MQALPKTRSQRSRLILTTALFLCLPALGASVSAQDGEPELEEDRQTLVETARLPTGDRLLYTTYFYTAGEAIIHGYEDQTMVRVVSMQTGQLVWEGRVDANQTHQVNTGAGVFSFLADRKASILVGTPSSCTVVGYWLRDRDGSHLSNHFLAQMPSGGGGAQDRLVVWAMADTNFSIHDQTTNSAVSAGTLSRGERFEIDASGLAGLRSHLLTITADSKELMVQIYQDEGFTVPSTTGRGSGTEFFTFVGDITEGVNDLNLISYHTDAQVRVEDIDTEEVLWEGTVAGSGAHTLSMTNRFVRITSDVDISAIVAPYSHYGAGYAEHHFSLGAEGTGIENDFILPTPGELWIFSYYGQNHIRVEDLATGAQIWEGTLEAGHVSGLTPGHGFYRVRSSAGISVQGGAMACGAEYSPAAGLFRVDEELMAAVMDIRLQRQADAIANGNTLTDAQLNAPLTSGELDQAVGRVQTATGNFEYSAAEVEDRLQNMVTE